MDHFWKLIKNDAGDNRSLYLYGAIADDDCLWDGATPAAFKSELLSGAGDVTVWINSPGGDVFAAAEIYTMLKEYPGKVTVKINGLAASAATVIAMAGAEVLMSPVSYMIIHNPATIAIGDSEEMLKTKALLDEIKEGIINAYEAKTGLPRDRISQLMDAESCFNARKAAELGFADGILYSEPSVTDNAEPVIFYRAAVTNSIINRLQRNKHTIPIYSLFNRLINLEHQIRSK